MADSQQVERPAAVTQAKRNSYLRHVQIHLELLQDSLAGDHLGCGLGQRDREAIEKHLADIWYIASTAKVAVVDPRPAPSADPTAAPGTQGGNVIPFRPRLARAT